MIGGSSKTGPSGKHTDRLALPKHGIQLRPVSIKIVHRLQKIKGSVRLNPTRTSRAHSPNSGNRPTSICPMAGAHPTRCARSTTTTRWIWCSTPACWGARPDGEYRGLHSTGDRRKGSEPGSGRGGAGRISAAGRSVFEDHGPGTGGGRRSQDPAGGHPPGETVARTRC